MFTIAPNEYSLLTILYWHRNFDVFFSISVFFIIYCFVYWTAVCCLTLLFEHQRWYTFFSLSLFLFVWLFICKKKVNEYPIDYVGRFFFCYQNKQGFFSLLFCLVIKNSLYSTCPWPKILINKIYILAQNIRCSFIYTIQTDWMWAKCSIFVVCPFRSWTQELAIITTNSNTFLWFEIDRYVKFIAIFTATICGHIKQYSCYFVS